MANRELFFDLWGLSALACNRRVSAGDEAGGMGPKLGMNTYRLLEGP